MVFALNDYLTNLYFLPENYWKGLMNFRIPVIKIITFHYSVFNFFDSFLKIDVYNTLKMN